MGETKNGAERLDFDGSIKLEFRGAKVTTDAGLLAVRELDEVLGLTDIATYMLSEARANNRRHNISGLFRQSVYARLAGYEDVNDQEALSRDPAMRAVIGRKALEANAASTATVSRFETEILTAEDNLEALAAINGAWVSRAMSLTAGKKVILDMNSSESPVHGRQEGSAYNGHFQSYCYHPLFVFNQHGDCEGAALRPGNVHSADGWRKLLEPVVERYKVTERSSTTGATPPSPHPTYMNTWSKKASTTPSGSKATGGWKNTSNICSSVRWEGLRRSQGSSIMNSDIRLLPGTGPEGWWPR